MEDNTKKNQENKETDNSEKPNNIEKPISKGRRNVLKALATVPVLGVMGYGIYKKRKSEVRYNASSEMFRFKSDMAPLPPVSAEDKIIHLGIIGFGIRGKQLMQGLGFATPEFVEDLIQQSKKDSKNTSYQDFVEQEDLRIEIVAVCDIFETYADEAVAAGANIHREGKNAKLGNPPKKYRTYQELLSDPNVDAVVIATPDHWHGTIAMAAANAGKHVYVEKPMTWTVPETYLLRETIKRTGIVFQLGHQNRQIEAYERARQIIEKNLLGKITLVETGTNRNDPNGAWVYPIHPDASPKTIDWKQFEGDPERIKEYLDYMTSANLVKYIGPEARDKFSLERFFRWRCWWDYSTGLSGDLLTHEYDAMNQILKLGIPSSASSSGGIYFFKDGRTVPDVLQTVFEYSYRGLTMLYSATLANQYNRGRKIMGHDATMEVGSTLTITVDPQSDQYKEKIQKGIIKPDEPFYTYVPGRSVDAVTTATEKYFAERGLLYSFIGGKRYNTTFLHLKEWLQCIRTGGTPSCNIDRGFEEAITAHMGTRAYLEGRHMYWDKEKEEITRG